MVKKLINKVNEWLEDGLRGLLGRLTPDRRVILIVTMLLVFGSLSIWMTFSSIYNFGKDKGERLKMEHIQRLEFELQRKQLETDSLKQLKQFQYEKE